MSRPRPEGIQVCRTCGQAWEDHIQHAYLRLMWSNEDETTPSEEEVEEAIDYIDCVALLKVANRGPVGPPGPQGPMGIQGRPA